MDPIVQYPWNIWYIRLLNCAYSAIEARCCIVRYGHLGLWAIIVDCMLTKQRVFYAAEEDSQDQNVLRLVLIDSAMDSLTVNLHACVGCKCAGF